MAGCCHLQNGKSLMAVAESTLVKASSLLPMPIIYPWEYGPFQVSLLLKDIIIDLFAFKDNV